LLARVNADDRACEVDRPAHPNRGVVIDDEHTRGLPVAAQPTVSRHEVLLDDPNGCVARPALPRRPPFGIVGITGGRGPLSVIAIVDPPVASSIVDQGAEVGLLLRPVC
jgi:hypothetical protein